MYNFGKNRQAHIDPEVPQSLESVINSLETLLEHRDHQVPASIQESLESFADSMGEQYDDPLVPEDTLPTLEEKAVEIPVLNDVVSRSETASRAPAENSGEELEILLDSLRSELDNLVEDILTDARDRFSEILEQASSKNSISLKDNLNDFMRDALDRHGHDS